MSGRAGLRDAAPPWATTVDAPIITSDEADETLTALEIQHTQFIDTQCAAAERLAQTATDLGRGDLHRRAELVIADVTIRQGDVVSGSAIARNVQAEAESASDAFAAARSYYMLAWAAQSIGDAATAQINGIRSVELLPDTTHRSILMDHLMIVAIAHNPEPGASHYFDEALSIALEYGDPDRILMVHNNIAYAALDRSEMALATEHVAAMLQLVADNGMQLSAGHLDTVATVYLRSGRPAEAIAMLEPVRRVMYLPPDRANTVIDTQAGGLPLALVTLAQAHRDLGRLDTAEEMLCRASEIAEGAGLRPIKANISRQWALIHAARGEFELALGEYMSFHEAMATLQSEDQEARALIVQASFDAERDRKRADHFRELAMRDALTGIYNRRFMDDLLDMETSTSAALGIPLSVAIMDADHFKRINDEYSHEVGDEVLRSLAAVLLRERPQPTTVCRLGGEEFVLIMPNTDSDTAHRICETLRAAVAEHDWQPVLPTGVALTISIGVTTGASAPTPTSLLSSADKNLYRAKRSGRNRVAADAS